MTPERWQQIDHVFQAAIELQPDERAAFLDRACAGDETLRKEVEALLNFDKQELSIIETPVLDVAANLLANAEPELAVGQRIGHYKILDLLGTGGMGEVYLAQDTRLGRKIALKLLPAEFIKDEERLRRFQREARAISSLNHPNILTIHEISEIEGRHVIATEYVEGETLRQRLVRSKLSLPEALEIAIQVASALEAAHEAGIVHRDIKPENIMLRRDGYVKVLDFGLAKLTEHQLLLPDTEASTIKNVETTPGLIMGTVKYMSPEQARGLHVDARSDIFSFGVVLYEMIAGHAPFEGETPSDLIATLLKEEPLPLMQFSPTAPDELQRIISRALQKDKRERYQTTHDLLIDLKSLRQALELESKLPHSAQLGWNRETVTASGTQAAVQTAGELGLLTKDRKAIPTLSSAEYIISEIKRHKTGVAMLSPLLFIAMAAIGYAIYKYTLEFNTTASPSSIKLSMLTTSGKDRNAAISPDGKYVAYVTADAGQQSLWIKQVATKANVQIIPPGNGSYWGLTFSRDGNYLYYFGKEKGDPAPALYQIPAPLGGVTRKLIADVFNSNSDSPVTFSPDGTRLAFVREYPSGETAVIVSNADGTNERKLATRQGPAFFGSVAWSPDGQRIACAGGKQDAQGLYCDVSEIEIGSGAEKPISTQRWGWISNIAWLSDGRSLLITVSGKDSGSIQIWQIPYPTGNARRITTDLNNYSGLSLTADASALVTTLGNTAMNIWTQRNGDAGSAKEITSGSDTKDGWNGVAWTPDGKIVYSSRASGNQDIWMMDADGSNQKQLTVDLGSDHYGLSVSPDGRYIVFVSNRGGVWRVDIDGNNAKALTKGGSEFNPFFWPDGQWVCYMSYVSDKPAMWKVPVDGGDPVQLTGPSADILGISPDGKLIAYLPQDNQAKGRKIGIAPVEGGEPLRIIDLPPGGQPQRMQWAPDGRALTYVVNRGGVSNIWSQPVDGGNPVPLTDFKSYFIHSFAWSRDSQQLAIARGRRTSNIVLIKDFK